MVPAFLDPWCPYRSELRLPRSHSHCPCHTSSSWECSGRWDRRRKAWDTLFSRYLMDQMKSNRFNRKKRKRKPSIRRFSKQNYPINQILTDYHILCFHLSTFCHDLNWFFSSYPCVKKQFHLSCSPYCCMYSQAKEAISTTWAIPFI